MGRLGVTDAGAAPCPSKHAVLAAVATRRAAGGAARPCRDNANENRGRTMTETSETKPMKLFEVELLSTVYVLATTEEEASRTAERATLGECPPYVDRVQEVRFREWPLSAGWYSDSLVYGPAQDTTLSDALARLPRRS